MWTRPHTPAALLLALSLSACTTPTPPPTDSPTARVLHIANSVIVVTISGGPLPVPDDVFRQWLDTAARAVANYFGRFPVARVDLTVRAEGDGRISDGVTYEGRHVSIRLGRRTRPRDLAADWMLTHEFFHLGFPRVVDDDHNWMGEGLSTYLEPLARARVGNLTPEQVWQSFARDLPQGLPRPTDRGLDHTHTWGRTYWGGALFWFLADVRIRQRTGNRRSLDDAVRAILAAGGDGTALWDPARVFDVGDRATGLTVLRELHGEMGDRPVTPDLNALWQQLGVTLRAGAVTFDDAAPLAGLRRSMTAP